MRGTAIAIIGALALTAAAQTANAQSAGDKADARCILALQLAIRDPKFKEAAVQGSFYYMGRMVAHGLSGKLEPLLQGERKMITAETVQSELTRCGTELTASTNEFRAAFTKMQSDTAPAARKPQ